MNVARWERIKDIVHEALQRPENARARYLDEVVQDDTAIRTEIESLLAVDGRMTSGFLQHADSPRAPQLTAGQEFSGHFRLVRKLGEGGMGQVWLAEQLAPVRRQVALKLIVAGMYDERMVGRFQAERQSLAMMDHPCIAKVFEAGSSPMGQPYFVMEYVPGLAINDYCDQKRLSIRDRVGLLIQACEGVQHAHQKAVIHRDLKPANILIVEIDGKPVPRIIDFGLARPLVTGIDEHSQLTRLGQLVGTPGYMSPEQLSPDSRDVDTRADVYALGVILYVLLTGTRPFEEPGKPRPPLDQWLRQLREDEPPSPSSKVMRGEEPAKLAAARNSDAKSLVRQLRGDLDVIARKALERDRDRRYATPLELAADLRHYLNEEPVSARPPGTYYQLQKFLRRHRVAASLSAAMLVLLVAFAALEALQLQRITRERDRATRITEFMTNIFKVTDPSEARGNQVSARELLDRASNDAGKALAAEPDVQSQMLQLMSVTYTHLGLLTRARELAERSLEAQRQLYGLEDRRTLESLSQLGWILDRQGKYDEAEELERQAVAGARRVAGRDAPLTLHTMDQLAVTLQHQGHFDESERLGREVVTTATRRDGPDSLVVLRALNNLGTGIWKQGRLAEAESIYRRLLEGERRVLGPDAPETLLALGNLGGLLGAEGHFAEAEPILRELLDADRRVLGSEHHNTALAMMNLGEVMAAEGHLQDAEALQREVIALQLRILGPEHAETLLSQLNLAGILRTEGHLDQAEQIQRQTLETQTRVLGAENPDTLLSQADLAQTLDKERHYAEAESLAKRTFAVQSRLLGPLHPDALATLQTQGIALAHQRRYAEAQSLFQPFLYPPANASQGNPWSAWYALACVAAAAGRTDDAMQQLRRAVSRGYGDGSALENDADLAVLRPMPEFKQLVATLAPNRRSGAAAP